MKKIFKDDALQKHFAEKGYVIVPFLDEEQIKAAHKLFTTNFTEPIEGLHPSVSVCQYEARTKISQQVQQIFEVPYARHFDNYEFFFGHFMTKSHINSAEFSLHQDWEIVDESSFFNAQVWCPLLDTAPENGGMFVIEGSHLFFGNVRSGSFGFHSIKRTPELSQHIKPLYVKAGHALIYHNAVFHGSFPNQSNDLRVAIFGSVYSNNATLIHHRKSDVPNHLEHYRIDRDYFLKNLSELERGVRPPKDRLINTLPHHNIATSDITAEKLLAKINNQQPIVMQPPINANRESLNDKVDYFSGQLGFKTMKKVFKDPALQAAFEKDGYVIIPHFYTPEEMAELEKLYRTLHPKDEKGFYPSTFSKDHHYRSTADSEIKRLCKRSMDKYLENIKVICGSYIVKSPGPDSEMGIHQDMTLVDETVFNGINIWCPLIDLNDKNGALYALKGSHKIMPTLRGSTIPGIYDDTQKVIHQYMKPLYLKAGEAIIFDQSIIHYSPPNLSDNVRIVTNTFFTHQDAKFVIAYWDKEAAQPQVELFAQPDDFMTNYDQFGHEIFARPKMGKSLGMIDYHFPKLTEDQLHELYGDGSHKVAVEQPIQKPQEVAANQTNTQTSKQRKNGSLFKKIWRLFSKA